MSENNEKKPSFFSKLITENPVFGLYLGICSTLAISTSVNNAIGMGVGVIVVLVLSNIVISMIAKITPDDIHIPVYIVVIATLVTILEMFMHAYTPDLYTALGAFLSLIVVNCIILGRAEAFACNHSVGESALDGLQMGLAYTCSLLCMSLIRQIIGTGVLSLANPFTNAVIFSWRIIPESYTIPFMTGETGAFFTFACLAAAVAVYKESVAQKSAKKEVK
ncbi:MAG: electron transport complex subunit RsxE [Erysipelotrichaceae bacterium]|jgi:electron transport complex protein RnfE|nr:electron transport complex subunit RsxE [Erysipelotrichaceae bacterium]